MRFHDPLERIDDVAQHALSGKLGSRFIRYGIVIGLVKGQMKQQPEDAATRESGRPLMVTLLLGGIVLAAYVVMTCTRIYKLVSGIAEGGDIVKFGTYSFECTSGLTSIIADSSVSPGIGSARSSKFVLAPSLMLVTSSTWSAMRVLNAALRAES